VIEDRVARYRELRRAYEQAKEAGKTVKIWRTAGDETVRDSHAAMDGVAVGIEENFEVGGEALFLPSDPDASLDETANCRCTVEYEVAQAGGAAGNSAEIRIEMLPIHETYQAWAPPLAWGPWKNLEQEIVSENYRVEYLIEAETRSNAPSSFIGEVEYFNVDHVQVRETFRGSHYFVLGDGAQVPKALFRSLSLGQNIHFQTRRRIISPEER